MISASCKQYLKSANNKVFNQAKQQTFIVHVFGFS